MLACSPAQKGSVKAQIGISREKQRTGSAVEKEHFRSLCALGACSNVALLQAGGEPAFRPEANLAPACPSSSASL